MTIFFMPPRNAFERADFTQSLVRLKSDGVNSLYLVPYFFADNQTADSLFSTAATITNADLSQAITLAQSYGFTVTLKPHVDLRNNEPRFKINPADIRKWCRVYQRFIDTYVRMSITHDLASFVVGTELDGVADSPEFLAVVDSIRREFPGTLTYAASYDHFVGAKIWDHVDVIGVNAYFNLDNNDDHSYATLIESWNHWLNLLSDFSTGKGKPVVLTEVGYFSREGAAKNPGSWDRNTPPNMQEQADCYEALLCQAMLFERISGMYWWQWELGAGDTIGTDATPRQKPAEEVIRKYWGDAQ